MPVAAARILGVALGWLLASAVAVASVPVERDYAALGRQAAEQRLPILIAVSQAHCAFCERLKAEILRPMLISGDYDDQVLIRELLIDPGERLCDFEGRLVDGSEFGDRYKVWVTPTVLLLAPDGRELHPRLLGINNVEMYGYYLDQAIAKARQRLRSASVDEYRPSREDIGAWPKEWEELLQ